MKRVFIVISIIFITFSIQSCKNNQEDTDSFLAVNELSSYENNAYFLRLYLDEDLGKLIVEGSLVYVNDKQDFEEIYLTMFPNAYNRESVTENNVSFEYLKINDVNYDVVFSGEDNTSIHINLLNTLEKNYNYLIEFKYEFKYWDFGRLCKNDDYYITMFFYPYVSVYDEFGWNIEPYTFIGESYYNEIGDYYVVLNVPNDYYVASSGEKIEIVETSRSRKEIKYKLLNGRDFSFSTCPYYAHYERFINNIKYEIYSISELTVPEIELAFAVLLDSYNLYTDLIGEYDKNHITLELGNIYGMESSGIIYCSREIEEGTIVHEMIHQWFYSIIGNDQSDFSFIDESLTTFTTGLYFKEYYGEDAADQYYNIRSSYRSDIIEHFDTNLGTSMLRKVDEYGDEYAYIIYYHGVTLFKYYIDNFLEGDYDLFINFMEEYYNNYKYKVVSLDDFLNLLEETTGVENTYEWFMLMLNEFQDVNNLPN